MRIKSKLKYLFQRIRIEEGWKRLPRKKKKSIKAKLRKQYIGFTENGKFSPYQYCSFEQSINRTKRLQQRARVSWYYKIEPPPGQARQGHGDYAPIDQASSAARSMNQSCPQIHHFIEREYD